jgi:hypothetical protein
MENQLQLGQTPGLLSGIYRESCLGFSGISSDALSLTTVDRCSFGRLPCFSTYRGITNATHDTLVSLFYWKYASTIRLVLRLVDAGWLAGWYLS